MEIGIATTFDVDELARELTDQLTHEELLDFIVTLDLFAADWGFTKALYKWAKGEHKTYKAEIKEYS